MKSEFDFFIQLLESKYQLSKVASQDWSEILELKHYKKGSFFAKAKELTSKEVFISKGLIRSYYQVDNKQKNSAFFGEGQFITPWHIRTSNSRSTSNFHFLENSTVLVFDAEKFAQLRLKHKELQRIGESIVEQEFNRLRTREVQLLGMQASERFDFFCKEHAPILNKLSQYHIASYLNISPVSLSRLKLEQSKNKEM